MYKLGTDMWLKFQKIICGASLMLQASCRALRHLRTGTSVQYWTEDCFETQSLVSLGLGLVFFQADMIGAVHGPKGQVHPLLLTGRVLRLQKLDRDTIQKRLNSMKRYLQRESK